MLPSIKGSVVDLVVGRIDGAEKIVVGAGGVVPGAVDNVIFAVQTYDVPLMAYAFAGAATDQQGRSSRSHRSLKAEA